MLWDQAGWRHGKLPVPQWEGILLMQGLHEADEKGLEPQMVDLGVERLRL
jgi:hypothetical protein